MNIINFINRFPDEAYCVEFSKSKEFSRESSVRNTLLANITGLKTSFPFSVPLVGSEPALRAVQSRKAVIYRLVG
jgi:hypothetical protein